MPGTRRIASLLLLLAAGGVQRAFASPPDIVLVTLDTVRWDAVGFDGRTPSPTPNLDRLAAAGRVFTDAHAHNVVTLPSHTNILTGLYPYQHGVRDNIGFRVPENVPTLATALRAAGFATGAFVGAFPLDSQFGLDRGFEVYDDAYPKGTRPEEFAMPERRGDQVVAAALAWWKKTAGRPRFLWVHLYDAHAPYAAPEPFASRYRAAPYFGEVAAVDAFLGPLLEVLRAPGAPRSLVAVTADHGEALGDHGELTHGLFAYEATLKVPLLLWGAGVSPGRDERPARHVDIFPTLLAAAGVAPPLFAYAERPGRSLLLPAAPRVDSYFEALSTMFNRGWAPLRGMLSGGRKAIALPLPELYDLPRDPAETKNLIDADRPAARALFDGLPKESAWPPPRGASGTGASELRALGYLPGEAAPKSEYAPEDDPKKLVALDGKLHDVIEAYERRDFAQSARLAKEVVGARPSMPMGHALLAQALLETGNRDDALKVMRTAYDSHLATDGLVVQLGLTLSEAGRSQEAIEILRPLQAKREPRFSNALGVALSDAGKQEEAETALRDALALDPEFAKAWENLALVALRRGRFAEARELAEKAVALNPQLHLAWNDLGVALFQLGQREAALDAWAKAVKIEPQLWDAQWNLGVQGAALGRKETAREALRRFVAGAPPARYARDVERARQLLSELGG
jgi:arylsulfatase A-like enzyme/Flp pilus assembly protein TadD